MKITLCTSILFILLFTQISPAYAEDFVDYGPFSMKKIDGMTYYTRETEIDSDNRTTHGFMLSYFEEYLGVVFNDEQSAQIMFYPMTYTEVLSRRACITELLTTCYAENAGMFDDSFTIRPVTNYIYNLFSWSATNEEIITIDTYYLFMYDGIIEISGTSIKERTGDSDYSYDYGLFEFTADLAMSVSTEGFMRE